MAIFPILNGPTHTEQLGGGDSHLPVNMDPKKCRTGDCERAKNTQKYRTKQLDQHTSHSLPKPKKTNNKTMGEMV